MTKSKSKETTYNEIGCYFQILSFIGIGNFDRFEFPDCEDGHTVIVDAKEYDLDVGTTEVLKAIEKKMNAHV